MKRLSLFATAMCAVFFPTLANASIIFYTSREAFEASVAGMSLWGVENWSSAEGTGTIVLDDALMPGSGNGPFPNGTNPTMGITVQSNILGNDPFSAGSRGTNGLFFADGGTLGVSGNIRPSQQVYANTPGDSIDVLFSWDESAPRAVDLASLYRRINGTANSATLTVRVYDTVNTLLGSTTFSNVADASGIGYLGLIASGDSVFGRLNVSVDGSALDTAGVDDIRVYGSVPEPATLAVLAPALLLLRRRKKLG